MDNKFARRKTAKGERGMSKTDALEHKRREFLKDKLKEKMEHERRALQVVERLSETAVSEDFLINCAHLITADNYKDIVEERSIAKLCGYPICLNQLDNVPKQKYKISTKTNKVYDISERKFFCCNFCYKASKWFAVQISKTPLWLREDERTPVVKLLKKQDGGSSGLEVMLTDRPVKEADIENPVLAEAEGESEMFCNSRDDYSQEDSISKAVSKCHLRVHWGELPQGSGDIQGTQAEKEDHQLCCIRHHPNKSDCSIQMMSLANASQEIAETCTNADCEVEEFLNQSSVRTNQNQYAAQFPDNSAMQKTNETGPDVIQVSMNKADVAELWGKLQHFGASSAETASIKLKLMENLKLTLLQWKTDETTKFLYGSDSTMGDLYLRQPDEEEELDEDDIQEILEDDLFSTRGAGNSTTPAPDYTTLCRATPAVDVNIKEVTAECRFPQDSPRGTKNQDVTSEAKVSKDPVLPLVDCHSQQVIQKRIVVERLSRSLKNIVGPLHLTMSDISSHLNNLVRTLRPYSSKCMGHPEGKHLRPTTATYSGKAYQYQHHPQRPRMDSDCCDIPSRFNRSVPTTEEEFDLPISKGVHIFTSEGSKLD